MKIVCWNLNGIKTVKQYHPWTHTSDFAQILDQLDAEVFCFQEIKATRGSLPTEFIDCAGYDCFYSLSKTAGYCGVATIARKTESPSACEIGITGGGEGDDFGCLSELRTLFTAEQLKEIDSEARALITDHGLFLLINVYCPHDSGTRTQFKMDFLLALQTRVESLISSGRRVIVAGDVNVSHREIDHWYIYP